MAVLIGEVYMYEADPGPQSNSGWVERLLVISVVSLVLIAPLSAQTSVESPKSTISKKELKSLLANAKTFKDHQEIAAHFLQQARIFEEKRQKYQARCSEVAEYPMRYKTKYPSEQDDCRFWAQYYAVKSIAAENEARLHEQLAKQLREDEKSIASKRTKEMVIVLTNDSGRLTGGSNNLCAVFQSLIQSPGALRRCPCGVQVTCWKNPR